MRKLPRTRASLCEAAVSRLLGNPLAEQSFTQHCLGTLRFVLPLYVPFRALISCDLFAWITRAMIR